MVADDLARDRQAETGAALPRFVRKNGSVARDEGLLDRHPRQLVAEGNRHRDVKGQAPVRQSPRRGRSSADESTNEQHPGTAKATCPASKALAGAGKVTLSVTFKAA